MVSYKKYSLIHVLNILLCLVLVGVFVLEKRLYGYIRLYQVSQVLSCVLCVFVFVSVYIKVLVFFVNDDDHSGFWAHIQFVCLCVCSLWMPAWLFLRRCGCEKPLVSGFEV